MKYILKYKGGKKTRRVSTVMPDFNSMQSIYNSDGTLKSYSELGFNSLDNFNKTLETTIGKGYGSFKVGDTDYTIYLKDLNNKIIKPWEQDQYKELLKSLTSDPNYYSSVNSELYNNLGLIAAANYINKPKNGGYLTYRPIFNLSTSIQDETNKNLNQSEVVQSPQSLVDKYNITNDLLGNIQSIPDSGRKSNFRSTLGLIEDLYNYFNDANVSRSMNHYYGINWHKPSILFNGNTINPLNNVRNTLDFVTGNRNLLLDRYAKSNDYLAMESARLDRTIGKYKDLGLTYRDLLNYYNNDDNFNGETIGNGQYTNKLDFIEALYKLGASRNGMQNHELKRLLGDNYDYIISNIISTLKPKSKNGGTIKMLFI